MELTLSWAVAWTYYCVTPRTKLNKKPFKKRTSVKKRTYSAWAVCVCWAQSVTNLAVWTTSCVAVLAVKVTQGLLCSTFPYKITWCAFSVSWTWSWGQLICQKMRRFKAVWFPVQLKQHSVKLKPATLKFVSRCCVMMTCWTNNVRWFMNSVLKWWIRNLLMILSSTLEKKPLKTFAPSTCRKALLLHSGTWKAWKRTWSAFMTLNAMLKNGWKKRHHLMKCLLN